MNVTLPDNAAISLQLWRLVYDRKRPIHLDEAYEYLSDLFSLTSEQKNIMNPSDGLPVWKTRIRASKYDLLKNRIIKRTDTAKFEITPLGVNKYQVLYGPINK